MNLRGRSRGWLLCASLLAAPSVAAAQVADPLAPPDTGAGLTVALVTIGPGAAVWERFGHNLLWVRGAGDGFDAAWDWGRFTFDRGFFLRFARGDLRYWMQGAVGTPVVDWYAGTGRHVGIQELDLTSAQRVQLLALLRDNDTDANRYYQYHYYLDNCSTRIRDALDVVLAGALRARTDTVLTPWSYREQTQRLNQHNPVLYFGLTTLLAGATDRKITAWEEMFLPEGVARWVRAIEVPHPDGSVRPLVSREEVRAPGGQFPVPDAPSRWWPGFLLVGLVAMGGMVVTARSRGRLARAFVPLAAAYSGVAGLLGLTMALLWAASGHEVAWRNENLWQFNLATLALLPLLPAAPRGAHRRAQAASWLALAIAGCSLLGILLKILPGFDQANWDVIALAVPANLGLAWGVLRRSGRVVPAPASPAAD